MRERVLLLPLALAMGCSCSPAPSKPDPVLPTAAPKSLAPDFKPTMAYRTKKLRDHDDFSELIIMRGAMADGGSMYSRVRITNVGPADKDADFRISVRPMGGDPFSIKYKRDEGDWSASKSDFAIDFKGARVTVTDKGIDVIASKGGNKAEMHIERTTPVLQPVGPNDLVGGNQINSATLLVPKGTFKVTLTRKGGQPETYSGTAFAEHRVATIVPYRLAKGFHTVLDLKPNRVVSIWGAQLSKALGGNVRGWMLVIEDGKEVVYDPRATFEPGDLRKDGKTGYMVPHKLTVKGKTHSIELTSPDGPKPKDDLGGLNALQRLVVERLTKPWSFRFDDTPFKMTPTAGGDAVEGSARYIYQQLN